MVNLDMLHICHDKYISSEPNPLKCTRYFSLRLYFYIIFIFPYNMIIGFPALVAVTNSYKDSDNKYYDSINKDAIN